MELIREIVAIPGQLNTEHFEQWPDIPHTDRWIDRQEELETGCTIMDNCTGSTYI